jgi:cytochrome P450
MEKAFKNIMNARVKLEKELKGSNIDAKAIRERIYGSDLLGMMLEIMYAQNSNMTMSQVLDECKTMCLATDNPCALLLMWTLTLLAIHPDWQQRARSEVQHVFVEAPPQPENLSHLKLVPIIIPTISFKPKFLVYTQTLSFVKNMEVENYFH